MPEKNPGVHPESVQLAGFMINYAQIIFCLLLATVFQVSSCGGNSARSEQSLLLGKWEINEALRNGRPTESLDQLYFEFYEDGQMNTNLSGEAQAAVYDLEKGVIHQRKGSIDADYKVEALNDSLLVLSTSLRNFTFRFRLLRKVQEE